jgi:hypothetical protein
MRYLINNFTAGEWTPLLDSRVDFERYATAAREIYNWRVLAYGGARTRPGFLQFGKAASGLPISYSDEKRRLFAFYVSDIARYVLAFGSAADGSFFVEIYQVGASPDPLRADSLVLRITRPAGDALCYTADEIDALQVKQLNDVLYIVHENHPVAKLSRVRNEGSVNFILAEMAYAYPPFLDENTDSRSLRISNGYLSASGVFSETAPADIATVEYSRELRLISNTPNFFTAADVGNWYLLKFVRVGMSDQLFLDPSSLAAGTYYKIRSVTYKVTYSGAGEGIGGQRRETASMHWTPYMNVAANSPELAWAQGHLWNGRVEYPGDDKWEVYSWTVGTGGVTSGHGVISDTYSVEGDWSISTSGFWWGTLYVERSEDGGSKWDVVRKYEGRSDRQAVGTGRQLKRALFRLRYESHGDPYDPSLWNDVPETKPSAKPVAHFEVGEMEDEQLVHIISLVDGEQVRCEVDDFFLDTNGEFLRNGEETSVWNECAWSYRRGFPGAIGFHGQRLFLGRTADRPSTIWASQADDFENFKYGTDDADAMMLAVASSEQSPLRWMESLKRLHLATANKNISLYSENGPVTPTSLMTRVETFSGASDVPPVMFDERILYVSRHGTRLNELTYSFEKDGFSAADLSILSPHVLASGVRQLAFSRQPDPQVWAVCNDGTLGVFTYDADAKVNAWQRWQVGSDRGYDDETFTPKIESLCVLPGEGKDDVFAIVRRYDHAENFNGLQYFYRRRLERLSIERNGADAVCVDSAMVCENDALTTVSASGVVSSKINAQYSLGDLLSTVAWFRRSDGTSYCVAMRGRVDPVQGGGSQIKFLNYDAAYTFEVSPYRVVVGYPYECRLTPMRIDALFQDGATIGRKRRITEVTVRLHNTVSLSLIGREGVEPLPFRSTSDQMDQEVEPFTGDISVAWGLGYDNDAKITLVQNNPFPATVLGLFPKWDITQQ